MNEYIIPFEPSTPIPAKTKAVVYAEIRGLTSGFKPEYVIIGSGVANSFDVHEIKAQGKSQFSAPGPIPGGVFAEKTIGYLSAEQHEWLRLFRDIVLGSGERVELTVENKTDGTVPLCAVLIGKHVAEVKAETERKFAEVIPGVANKLAAKKLFAEGAEASPLGTIKELLLRMAGLSFDAGVLGADITRKDRGVLSRRYVMGFDTTRVEPGQTAYVTKRPQLRFRPEDLSIPDEAAQKLKIVDIKVGKCSQFVSSGNADASAFSDKAPQRPTLHLDIAEVSMDVTLTVYNHTTEPVDFSATIVGSAAP